MSLGAGPEWLESDVQVTDDDEVVNVFCSQTDFLVSSACACSKFLCVVSLMYCLRRLSVAKEAALRGDKQAAQSRILPVFEPLITLVMYEQMIELLLFFLKFFVVNKLETPTSSSDGQGVLDIVSIVLNSVLTILYNCVRDGLMLVFLQPAVSKAAFARAAKWLSLEALLIVASSMIRMFILPEEMSYVPIDVVLLIIMSFYVISLSGSCGLRLRPAARLYVYFLLVYRAVFVFYGMLFIGWVTPTPGVFWPTVCVIACLELPLGYMWYLTLLRDTRYWRHGTVDELKSSEMYTTSGAQSNSSKKASKKQHSSSNSVLFSPLLGSPARGSLQGSDKKVALLAETDDASQGCLMTFIEENKKCLVDFVYLDVSDQKIGSGAFSFVYRGEYKQDTPVAVKFFSNMPDITRSTIALFARETAITASLKHPNIIRFYGLCVMPPTISLVFELAEYGDLRRVLRNRHLLPHWDAKLMIKFCMDCARAVAYLHSRGIIHRDLKSLNYLVTKDWSVKLTDFGLSRKIMGKLNKQNGNSDDLLDVAIDFKGAQTGRKERTFDKYPRAESDVSSGDTTNSGGLTVSFSSPDYSTGGTPSEPWEKRDSLRQAIHLTRAVGTQWWMSPEMMQGLEYSEKTDVYSLAMVLYEIVSCRVPFGDRKKLELYNIVVKQKKRPALPSDCPPALAVVIERCWAHEPRDRPTAAQLMQELTEISKSIA